MNTIEIATALVEFLAKNSYNHNSDLSLAQAGGGLLAHTVHCICIRNLLIVFQVLLYLRCICIRNNTNCIFIFFTRST